MVDVKVLCIKLIEKGGCFHINNVPPQVGNTPLNGGRLDEVAVRRKGPDAEVWQARIRTAGGFCRVKKVLGLSLKSDPSLL